MRFPETPRVIFENNPLNEVICQLRYPPILKIEAEDPAAFQERIRREYPLFSEERSPQLAGTDLPPSMAKLIADQFGGSGSRKKCDFQSEDGNWIVGLARDFIALSASKYEAWEIFKGHFRGPFDALVEVYSPSFFSRVGLRYQDVIRRSALGLEGTPWAELLKPPFAGELADPEIWDGIDQAKRQLRIVLPNGAGFVQLRHGLTGIEGSDEQCFVIDMDFFTEERTEVGDALAKLDSFNRLSGSLFRHCITPRLIDAMAPQSP